MDDRAELIGGRERRAISIVTYDRFCPVAFERQRWGIEAALGPRALRVDSDDRRLYAETKRGLAARDWPDMNAYADAKTEVIAAITERAECWALATTWRPNQAA